MSDDSALNDEDSTSSRLIRDQMDLAAMVMARLDRQDARIGDLEEEIAVRDQIIDRMLQAISTTAGFFQNEATEAAELLAKARHLRR